MEIINLIIEQSGKKRKIPFNIYDTIKNVLTKACEEFNISSEEHELWYANKLLDMDLQLNKTELSPEAVLELCPCKCSSNQSVAVDLIIGNNIASKKFKCSATLWDISQQLLPENKYIEDDRIQISYFGKTVVGRENLEKIRIASLSQNEDKLILKLSRNYSGTDLATNEVQRKAYSVTSSKLSTCRSNKGENRLKNMDSSSHAKPQEKSTTKKIPTRRFIGSIKALSSIDKSVYKNSNEKVKGIVHLDQRKGLIYNLKSVSSVGKTGSDLLGFNEENPSSLTGKEKEIPLKVIFPDQSVIQATFSSEEKVGDISNFISSLLKCPSSNFILYTRDPKCDLDQEMLLKNIFGNYEDTLYVRSCPGVPKLLTFQSLKEMLQPTPLPSFKNNKKQWMISIKK